MCNFNYETEELYVRKGDSQVGSFKPDTVGSDIGHVVEAQLNAGRDEQTRIKTIFAYDGNSLNPVQLEATRPTDTICYQVTTVDWFGQQKDMVIKLENEL